MPVSVSVSVPDTARRTSGRDTETGTDTEIRSPFGLPIPGVEVMPEVFTEAGAERALQLVDRCLLDPSNRSEPIEQRPGPSWADAGHRQ